ncbi:multidrug resistance protein, MATE family [Trypanosoma conorhini]|uniref:Multidrug resistance protein, MATE family n=1 Tax=Trypanosoma conorhini TaxID=83891 RepID=A0A422N9J5_9TRYP|nr:multidrug resistance protein, MATE family [Trypanosoma conorhini]RNF02154.1 multidrug resistance protein, MATE family [Trypanosoma conorhini]
MTALVVGFVVTPLAQYFFAEGGVHGAMPGMVIVAWVQLAVLVALVVLLQSTRQTLGKLRIREALQRDGLKEYIGLAIPSSLFVAAKASAFDVAMLLLATLGTSEVAAYSAILSSLFTFVSISGGTSTAASARIGSSLGAALPFCAWGYVVAAAAFALTISSLNGIIIFVFFDNILGLFVVAETSLEVSHTVRWIVPLTHIVDGTQYVFQGVFGGMGHKKKVRIF